MTNNLSAEQWDDVIRDARGWCEDCFSDYSARATDVYVLAAVEHQYDGGLDGFITDGQY